MQGSERAGLGFAALCILNSSFVPAFARLTTQGADPLFVAAVTTAFGAAAAAVVLSARRELAILVSRERGPRLLLVGFLGTALAFTLFFEGAARATAIDTALCLQSEPAYSLLVSWLFLGHRPSLRRVLSAALIGAGIFLAVGAGGGGSQPLGLVLLLVTPLCWQVSHLVVLRGLAGVPPSVLTGARYLFGGILLVLFWLARGGHGELAPSGHLPQRLGLLAVQGVILSYVGTLLWYKAIARLDLARATAIVVPSIPIASLGATFLLLGEVPTPRQWVGLAAVAAGVLSFVVAPHPHETQERVPAPTAPIAVPADPDV
jgi:drug/metabolite transporter (DMT)-like permease